MDNRISARLYTEKTSSEIYRQIMKQGWSEEKQSFVQFYGSDAVDASALLMVTTNFTSPKEPRMQATIRRIQRELTSGPLVYRYNRQDAADDGLAGQEATFSTCSFWLVEDLARAGHVDEARLQLEELLSYGNHVGLFAEEMKPTGEALGIQTWDGGAERDAHAVEWHPHYRSPLSEAVYRRD